VNTIKHKIILASSSKYRRRLLDRLGIGYDTIKPHVDENLIKIQCLEQKYPLKLIAEKLASAKAESVFLQHPDHIIIGSDQLLAFGNKILNKPESFENAFAQLKQIQGQTHELITAVTVMGSGHFLHSWAIHARMQMLELTDKEITDYLNIDQPYDCVGSYKLEAHGIRLFKTIDCADWTAIEGLPLLSLAQVLKKIPF